jgi:fructose-specific phosphotransferase system IIC component
MGKIVSIIGGTAAVVIGVALAFVWGEAFVLGLQFMVIVVLAMGGLIAVIAGVSEIKDSLAAKKDEEKKQQEEKK